MTKPWLKSNYVPPKEEKKEEEEVAPTPATTETVEEYEPLIEIPDNAFICAECGEIFKSMIALINHARARHT